MEPASGPKASLETLSFDALADLVLRQEQFPMRVQAMRMLAGKVQWEPELLARLAEGLKHAEPWVRRRTAQTLACCGAMAQPVLEELCTSMQTDPIWTVREAAVHAVRAISWPALEDYTSDVVPLQLLERALSDREPLVREAAIQALNACLSEEHVSRGVKTTVFDGLGSGATHSHASRRCRAITAICRLPETTVFEVLLILNAISDSHWKVRQSVAQALGENPQFVFSLLPAFILPELIRRLFDQHPVVGAAAREAVGRLRRACLDEAMGRMLEGLISKSSAVETLLLMRQSIELSSEAATQFRELCRRRMDWHLQNLTEPVAWSPTAAPVDAAEQLLSMAAKWQASAKLLAQDSEAARRAAEEKEAAWLLARWLEIFFAADDKTKSNG